MKNINLICFILFFSLYCRPSNAQDWTRFRGKNGNGKSNAKSIPTTWTDADLNWKTKLPGYGHSSPVQFGKSIYILSANQDDATRYVISVNSDSGKIQWQKPYPSSAYRFHRLNSYNSSTPAVDENHVYVAWSNASQTTLRALTHDGKEVWVKQLGAWVGQHGFAASPIVYQDKVIIANSQQKDQLGPGQSPGESIVYAFDAKTGQEIWQSKRVTNRVSYSVPCIFKNSNGVDELICCNRGEGVYSLNPETGNKNWSYDNAFNKRTVSSPVIAGGMILGSCGSGGGGNFVVAIKPGTDPKLAYKVDRNANYVPTPVVHDDLFFLVSDKGIAQCVEIETGKVLWRERLGGAYWSSPICIQDRIYVVSETGKVTVFAADRKFKRLGESELGEKSHATPAVSDGKLILRTVSHLMSVGGK